MTKYILMAVAGMLALSSCSNDDNEPVAQNAPRQMTFSAGYNEGAQTRATMDFSTKKVSFDAGDEISILSANNTNKEFTTEAGGASASFSGEAVNDTKFYAVYPYTAGLTLDSSTGVISGIEIPKSQWNNQFGKGYAGKSSWDPKAPIAYAVTTDENLQFHNLCAILKIKATGGWYGSMTISADQDLAGTFKLDTSTGTLTPTDGSKTVTIGNTSLEISASNMYMYIAIAPGSYTNFKVHAEGTDDRHQQQEKTKSSVTFAAVSAPRKRCTSRRETCRPPTMALHGAGHLLSISGTISAMPPAIPASTAMLPSVPTTSPSTSSVGWALRATGRVQPSMVSAILKQRTPPKLTATW